ncbi:MAG: hypothetical protein V4622_14325 [Bacteroidota bacterium]
MKKNLLFVTALSLMLFSCSGSADEAAKKEKDMKESVDKEMDKMFEESMEDLDDDVQEMEKDTETTTKTIEKEIKNGKTIVEEKTIEIKKEMK